jgi:FKBP-type peptidyl-prolyl cis-trans isomerase
MKKKDKITLTFRVVEVLPSEEMVRQDQQMQYEAQKKKEVTTIEQFLASKNIQAQKTTKGTFVVLQSAGNGPACDSGKMISVKYKGQTFGGIVFDSNLDSSFGHTDPYPLVIGTHSAIEGWDDGLRLFKKGGKGRLYVPSMLAYGGNPPQGAPFKPYENLIFDIEIVDVKDAPKTQPSFPPQVQPRANK